MIATSSHVFFLLSLEHVPKRVYSVAVGYLLFLQEQIKDHNHLQKAFARASVTTSIQLELLAKRKTVLWAYTQTKTIWA
jgi:hypothetical protein